MNPKYKYSHILEIVGILDKDENGKNIITIETKDETIVKDFDEIINNSLGELVAFKAITEIDE